MKSFNIILFFGILLAVSPSLLAQKMVPHSFHYNASVANRGSLTELVKLEQPSATSIRIYFDEQTQLGNGSYILLEGTNGSKQVLDSAALSHWHNSSAYFNGSAVRVSLFTGPDDQPSVVIKSVRIAGTEAAGKIEMGKARKNLRTSGTASTSNLIEDYPYAKAVGRFTNGNQAGGTGWIAPNGAIVTSYDVYEAKISEGYDIIEFNIPLSDSEGHVNHPEPVDQYPLDLASVKHFHESIYVRKWYWSVWSPHMFQYYPGYAIIKVLPNGTGKTPGQNEGQYFRILANPSSSVIEAQGEIMTDLFHYGSEANFGQYEKTLARSQSMLYKASDFITPAIGVPNVPHRDNYIIHDMLTNENLFSDHGAPITYEGTNVAIGIHVNNVSHTPAIGIGFRDSDLTNELTYFLSPKSVFVDAEGLYQSANGKVNKPFLTVQDAADNAANDAKLFIARGNYSGILNIDTPMTLIAPVGKVTIGVPASNARRSGENSIQESLLTDAPVAYNMKDTERIETVELIGFPNPFVTQTEIQYQLASKTVVAAKIYDGKGTEVATIIKSEKDAGTHTLQWDGRGNHGYELPSGLYIIQVKIGDLVKSVKVMKK